MRKARKPVLITLSVKLPPKKVQEKFLIAYELEGCQKGVDLLTRYYGVKRMRIVLNGKKVGKRKSNLWIACYSDNKAYFTKKGLTKQTVLHEFYHHLVFSANLELSLKNEERGACSFGKAFVKTQKS